MNKEELQSIVNEIKTICVKHGVILVGTCENEGIYGEITIGRPEQICWRNLSEHVDNLVIGEEVYGYSLSGIGEIK